MVDGKEPNDSKIIPPPFGDFGVVEARAQGVQEAGDVREVLSHPSQQPQVEQGEEQDARL